MIDTFVPTQAVNVNTDEYAAFAELASKLKDDFCKFHNFENREALRSQLCYSNELISGTFKGVSVVAVDAPSNPELTKFTARMNTPEVF